MSRSRYQHDHGATVVGSASELLLALDVRSWRDLEDWADAIVEPYVTLSPDGEDELLVSLDVGSSAVLTYPFSVQFLVETLEDLEGFGEHGEGDR